MTTGSGPLGEKDRNGNFPDDSGDSRPTRSALRSSGDAGDTGATFTKAPRELLERLGVPVEDVYTAELADGSRVERPRGRTVFRLEGKELPTPVTFGKDGEQSLLGAMALIVFEVSKDSPSPPVWQIGVDSQWRISTAGAAQVLRYLVASATTV